MLQQGACSINILPKRHNFMYHPKTLIVHFAILHNYQISLWDRSCRKPMKLRSTSQHCTHALPTSDGSVVLSSSPRLW